MHIEYGKDMAAGASAVSVILSAGDSVISTNLFQNRTGLDHNRNTVTLDPGVGIFPKYLNAYVYEDIVAAGAGTITFSWITNANLTDGVASWEVMATSEATATSAAGPVAGTFLGSLAIPASVNWQREIAAKVSCIGQDISAGKVSLVLSDYPMKASR